MPTENTPSGDNSQSTAGNDAPAVSTADALEREFGSDDDGSPATVTDDGDEHGTEEDEKSKEGDAEGEAEKPKEGEESEEPDEGGEDDESDEGEEGDDDGKPKSRTQTRIDELTAKRREAERDADYWRKKAEEAEQSRETTPETSGDAEPNPEDYDFGEADDKYLRDYGKWEGRMESRQEAAEAELQSHVRALDAKWAESSAKAIDRYEDFDAVVVEGGKEGKWKCPPVVAVGIKDSDYGADIAYELAKDPIKADKLSSLSPLEQAREFGRMEERYASKANPAAKADPQPEPKRKSNAPTPPKNTVRGGGGRFTAGADTDDFAAFERLADKSLAKK